MILDIIQFSIRVHVPKIVDTLAPKYLYRNYLKAKVDTVWVHGPFLVFQFSIRPESLLLTMQA